MAKKTKNRYLRGVSVVGLCSALCGCAGPQGFVDLDKPFSAIGAARNDILEMRFRSALGCAAPYNELTVDVVFEGPNNVQLRVPAFWRGDNVWAVRFSGEQTGKYTFKSLCSNTQDKGLHDRTGTITIGPYTGDNALLQHGRLRVAEDNRHFVHADGTAFFWLGDTWWMGLTKRLNWPEGFETLTADRVKKGFNLIQIVAGPLPDMDTWDQRAENEAGFPFEEGFVRINPGFYDHADVKIRHLVDSGVMPCIVGMWGYHLPKIGVERVKQYWRYIVARYGAYPVVWCVAGEGTMPYYLSTTRKEDEESQRQGWCEVAAYIREVDPYHNLLSIHPATNARDMSDEPGLFDFEMLQTGHSGYDSLPGTIAQVSKAVARQPQMPVVNSEVNYEGIRGQCWQDVQRLAFYVSVFNGSAGHTYGANGIWQLNEIDKPYGPSPHGCSWGNMPWQQAAQLPGGAQVALGGRFMTRFAWWQLEDHPEWVDSSREQTDYKASRCIGIARKVRLIYVPMLWKPPMIKAIEPDVRYRAHYFDPCTGSEHDLGVVDPDTDGNWRVGVPPPEAHDWLIVLEAVQ
ncbi:MAG: apiosidase-like domain-containing protein [Planctomycetota bacterium]|jgi:hypothetical protein